ncbi:MAG TPA: hypothetical protein VGM75_10950 [Pseudonocardiaceae bacterium]|jgi:hypothetical protein
MTEAERITHEQGRITMEVSSANRSSFRKDLVPGAAAGSHAARFPAEHYAGT